MAEFGDQRLSDRFWSKVKPCPVTGCWIWIAGLEGLYGRYRVGDKMALSHRVSYEALAGGIPNGLHIDHLCRVRQCVNPAHLEPVTQAENTRRGDGGLHHRIKTHCPSGHPYSLSNTYILLDGCRVCRTCNLASQARSREKKARREGRTIGPSPGERTHCPQGHPYSGENLVINRDGRRACRKCLSASSARYYARKKAKASA